MAAIFFFDKGSCTAGSREIFVDLTWLLAKEREGYVDIETTHSESLVWAATVDVVGLSAVAVQYNGRLSGVHHTSVFLGVWFWTAGIGRATVDGDTAGPLEGLEQGGVDEKLRSRSAIVARGVLRTAQKSPKRVEFFPGSHQSGKRLEVAALSGKVSAAPP